MLKRVKKLFSKSKSEKIIQQEQTYYGVQMRVFKNDLSRYIDDKLPHTFHIDENNFENVLFNKDLTELRNVFLKNILNIKIRDDIDWQDAHDILINPQQINVGNFEQLDVDLFKALAREIRTITVALNDGSELIHNSDFLPLFLSVIKSNTTFPMYAIEYYKLIKDLEELGFNRSQATDFVTEFMQTENWEFYLNISTRLENYTVLKERVNNFVTIKFNQDTNLDTNSELDTNNPEQVVDMYGDIEEEVQVESSQQASENDLPIISFEEMVRIKREERERELEDERQRNLQRLEREQQSALEREAEQLRRQEQEFMSRQNNQQNSTSTNSNDDEQSLRLDSLLSRLRGQDITNKQKETLLDIKNEKIKHKVKKSNMNTIHFGEHSVNDNMFHVVNKMVQNVRGDNFEKKVKNIKLDTANSETISLVNLLEEVSKVKFSPISSEVLHREVCDSDCSGAEKASDGSLSLQNAELEIIPKELLKADTDEIRGVLEYNNKQTLKAIKNYRVFVKSELTEDAEELFERLKIQTKDFKNNVNNKDITYISVDEGNNLIVIYFASHEMIIISNEFIINASTGYLFLDNTQSNIFEKVEYREVISDSLIINDFIVENINKFSDTIKEKLEPDYTN